MLTLCGEWLLDERRETAGCLGRLPHGEAFWPSDVCFSAAAYGRTYHSARANLRLLGGGVVRTDNLLRRTHDLHRGHLQALLLPS